jgi:hypothetical protein
LVPQAPAAIAMIIFFLFQMATLAVPVSAYLKGRELNQGNRTYMRSTNKREAEAMARYPKN